MKKPFSRCLVVLACLLTASGAAIANPPQPTSDYAELARLFTDWRGFVRPPVKNHVPDYRPAAIAAWQAALPSWRQRLQDLHTAGWSLEQQNDARLVAAEINGMDFELRVLRPWARDPAFYVSVRAERSDVPRREGPTVYPQIELYTYRFPLGVKDQAELAARLGAIPALLQQARDNLKDSNARDLWVHSVRELREQAATLASLQAGALNVMTLEGIQHADVRAGSAALRKAVEGARTATLQFADWLEAQAPSKTGPSGVGKDEYNWYQRNVHFSTLDWNGEVELLQRELDRAWSSLKLEEHANRALPQLQPAADAAQFDELARTHLDKFVNFLVGSHVIPAKDYIKVALEPQRGTFVPEERRVFFTRITHREPMLLMSHQYHWLDLARMRDEPHPSPIRRDASLFNIWDQRAEGFATAFEEIVMHAGLYADNPRARELVWIMLANRAARGLASLHVQANEWTLDQAGQFHARYTPRGWAASRDQLTAFEQLLYLRQPGYGTSYILGKVQFDQLLARFAQQAEAAGRPFVLSEFFDRFNGAGMVPIAIIQSEITANAGSAGP